MICGPPRVPQHPPTTQRTAHPNSTSDSTGAGSACRPGCSTSRRRPRSGGWRCNGRRLWQENAVTEDGYVRFRVTEDAYGRFSLPQPSSVTSGVAGLPQPPSVTSGSRDAAESRCWGSRRPRQHAEPSLCATRAPKAAASFSPSRTPFPRRKRKPRTSAGAEWRTSSVAGDRARSVSALWPGSDRPERLANRTARMPTSGSTR